MCVNEQTQTHLQAVEQPQNCAASPVDTVLHSLPPEEDRSQAESLPDCFLPAALFSYLLGYLYIRGVFLSDGFPTWGPLAFSIVYIAFVEIFSRVLSKGRSVRVITARASKETPFWALGWLVLSLCLWMYGAQSGGLQTWQLLAWHLFAIWYTLSRCGMLAEGHSGLLWILDGLAGLITIPWPGMSLRIRIYGQRLRRLFVRHAAKGRVTADKTRIPIFVFSAALALLLLVYAWQQLAAADENFAALGKTLLGWWRWPAWHISEDILVRVILSIPVGAWLFGLIGGCLKRELPPVTGEHFYKAVAPWQRLPALTVYLVLGALSGVYALFFAVQTLGFVTVALQNGTLRLSASAASKFAVEGFWELCRILILNFALLAVLRFSGPTLRTKRSVKMLASLFSAFGFAFSLLVMLKLGAYVHLYAFTPRRFVSGWFVWVLLFWCVLAFLWSLGVRVPFGHARLSLYGFVLAFLLLSVVNMNALIVRLDIGLYSAGQNNALDVSVLSDCGVGEKDHSALWNPQAQYAAMLQKSGWFIGRSSSEILALYHAYKTPSPEGHPDGFETETGIWHYTFEISPECRLALTFDGSTCTDCALTKQ